MTGASGADGNPGGWPVSQLIAGHLTPKAQFHFDNLTQAESGSNSGVIPFGTRYSRNEDGVWIEHDVALAAGTYTMEFHTWKYEATGILRFSLDNGDGGGLVHIDAAPYNASRSTIDTFSEGADGSNSVIVVTNTLTIPADGVYTLRTAVEGKNAGSTGYGTNFVYVFFQRIVGAIGVQPEPAMAAGGGYIYLSPNFYNSQLGFLGWIDNAGQHPSFYFTSYDAGSTPDKATRLP